jgi:ABC-type transport system involved in multi-copper enzyme maturation permease subunit
MISSIRAEWRKLRQRPAFAVSTTLLAAVSLFAYAYLYWRGTNPTARNAASAAHDLAGLLPAQFANNALPAAFTLGTLVAIVVGAIAFGSEYGWGTIKLLLTQRPGRLAELTGRVVVLSGCTAILTLALFGASAAGSLGAALAERQPVAWPPAGDVALAVGSTWLVLSTYALLGAVLGIALRQPAAAVGVSLVYVVLVERVVVQRLGELGWQPAENAGKLFMGVNAGALGQFLNTAPRAPGALPAPVGPGQAALVLAAYALFFVIVSAGLVWRRDVT